MPREDSLPFGNIALCLSGGGYRAATYSLGTMAMLDELDLLKDVKLLSTVSGGTFTGLTYAVWQSEKKTFAEFYESFGNYLINNNAVDKALDNLYKTPSPSGTNDLSLIRSAAEAYSSADFLDKKTFSQLLDITSKDGRFFELIFNATEFRGGNSFRFRASKDKTVFIGNRNYAVPKDVAAEIRLADIVAASSCFPGAFEPICFPDDFIWKSSLSVIRQKLTQDVKTPFSPSYPNGFNLNGECLPLPLMDGGIYDNQGITNAVMADRKNEFGLFIITDTSARDEDILNLPKNNPRRGWISLNTLFWVGVLLFIVCLASIGIIASSFFAPSLANSFAGWQIILAYLLAISPAFLLIGVLTWIYGQFLKFKSLTVSGADFSLWKYFKKMALPDALEMIKSRLSSVMAMTSNIFMKRIRQLQFNNLMNSDSRAKLITFNLIYTLNPSKTRTDLQELDPELEPTPKMKKISADAERVSTTLWMTQEQFDILIACGRYTTCFSLLNYLWQRWQNEQFAAQKGKPPIDVPKPNDPQSPHYAIYTKLKKKWEELKTENN